MRLCRLNHSPPCNHGLKFFTYRLIRSGLAYSSTRVTLFSIHFTAVIVKTTSLRSVALSEEILLSLCWSVRRNYVALPSPVPVLHLLTADDEDEDDTLPLLCQSRTLTSVCPPIFIPLAALKSYKRIYTCCHITGPLSLPPGRERISCDVRPLLSSWLCFHVLGIYVYGLSAKCVLSATYYSHWCWPP